MDVWVDAWATDYDGEGIVAIVYATEELAREAGSMHPQRCSIVAGLPEPMRWVKRSAHYSQGVKTHETSAQEVRYFGDEATEAWRGVHRYDGAEQSWVTVEMWAPDTPEEHATFEQLASYTEAKIADATTHYDRWTVRTPPENLYDAVSDYSQFASR